MADSGRRTRTRGPGVAQVPVKIEEPIYETVSEDAYKVESFIVDDGHLGYADDEREDWTDNDLTDADGSPKKKRPRKKSKPSNSNSGAVKIHPAPTPLYGLLDSSVLDSVLAEVEPDENDWEERRRRRSRVSAFSHPAAQIKTVSLITGSRALNTEVDMHDNHTIGSEIDANTNPEEAEDEEKSDYAETTRGVEQTEDEVDASEVNMAIEVWPESDDYFEFELNSDGSLPFYMIDAVEERFSANSGTFFLFGEVKTGNSFQSCCVVVKNLQRCVYAVPSSTIFTREAIEDLKRKHAESGGDSSPYFRAALRNMASGLKAEIAEKLRELNVSTFTMAAVKSNYELERGDIPSGEQYVIKISYPFKDPPLDADLKGENYLALMGTRTSALELFLIKRRIKRPSWLSISKFVRCSSSERLMIDGVHSPYLQRFLGLKPKTLHNILLDIKKGGLDEQQRCLDSLCAIIKENYANPAGPYGRREMIDPIESLPVGKGYKKSLVVVSDESDLE